MKALEVVQDVDVRRISRLGLFCAPQSELLKEHLSELFGGIDIERMTRKRGYLLRQRGEFRLGPSAKFRKLFAVDSKAAFLHIVEHIREGKLHIAVEKLLFVLQNRGFELCAVFEHLQSRRLPHIKYMSGGLIFSTPLRHIFFDHDVFAHRQGDAERFPLMHERLLVIDDRAVRDLGERRNHFRIVETFEQKTLRDDDFIFRIRVKRDMHIRRGKEGVVPVDTGDERGKRLARFDAHQFKLPLAYDRFVLPIDIAFEKGFELQFTKFFIELLRKRSRVGHIL